jgi:hypothetical protein
MGPNTTTAARRLVGAVLTEMRLRWIRDYYGRTGDPDTAADVKTIVGQPNSPLKTEADFQGALKNPEVKAALDRFRTEFVPLMESNYRKAEGLDDSDPIISPTQIPGLPVNLKGVDADAPDTGSIVRTGSRGKLTNQKLGKLPFARKATGSADGYDIDLGAIIENSLARGTTLAAKAELVRTLVENGLARFDKAGQRIELNGQPARGDIRMAPPRGTQEAGPGQDHIYLDPRVYDEVRRALKVDEPITIPVITPFSQLMTRAALVSTTEAAYHTKNNLTFLFKPGVSLIDFLNNSLKVIRGDPETQARIVELARIGAMKDSGIPVTGLGSSKWNPLQWTRMFLEVLGRAMRLSGDDAFNRMQRSNRIEGTETERRNFINQLGQYNQAAQQKIIALLRQTMVGGFSTAGSNWYVQGLRTLFLNPGVKATSMAAAIGLRAEMAAKLMAVLGSVALANYLLWKRVDGDDLTPLGAVKTGEKDGKTGYIDVTNLTGLTRGMREIGLLALAEGERKGDELPEITTKGVKQIGHSLIHPVAGPGVQFLHTAYTGENVVGQRLAEKPEHGESKAWKNLQAALWNFNPAVAIATGKDRPRDELTEDRWLRLFGPFAPRTANPPKSKGKKIPR